MAQPHVIYLLLDRELSVVVQISVADKVDYDGSRQGQKSARPGGCDCSHAHTACNSELKQITGKASKRVTILTRIIHDGLLRRALRLRGILVQYIEGARGEPAG